MLQGLDNSTLIVGQIILSLIVMVILVVIGRIYPEIRGVRNFAAALLISVGARLFFILDINVGAGYMAVAANCIALLATVLIYRGLLEYFGETAGTFRVLLAVMVGVVAAVDITTCILYGHETIVGITVYGVAFALVRGLCAVMLFRYASGNLLIRIFSLFFVFYAIYGMNQCVLETIVLSEWGAHNVHHKALTTAFLLFNVISSSLLGLFLMLLVGQSILFGVERQTLLDPLTGSMNRRAVDRRILEEIRRYRTVGTVFSVAMIDLDHFKDVNDSFGHAAGDTVLMRVSEGISGASRPTDLLGRLGGDEMVLIMPSAIGDQALQIAERICRAVRSATPLPGLRVSVSIGVTEIEPNDSAATILARADAALYAAKSAGRDCVRLLYGRSGRPHALRESG